MTLISLSDREKTILRYIIRRFILTASPVGSRNIAQKCGLPLSAASIRNIMSDLENAGFLGQPHTSAGRVPTDKGYRFYVDSLIKPLTLDDSDKKYINAGLEKLREESDDLLHLTSVLLSTITNQIACVTYPNFSEAELDKIQIIKLSSTRIMVVISIKSGLVKTITLELDSEIDEKGIYLSQQLINERLSGLKLSEIRKTIKERLQNIDVNKKPIIRVFFNSVDKIFSDDNLPIKAVITGAKNMVKQPEFGNKKQFESVVELIEDQDVIVHIMEKDEIHLNKLFVSIGDENQNDKLADYSLIKKNYENHGVVGTVGIIGPKRMEYSKSIAAVVYFAELLSKEIKNKFC